MNGFAEEEKISRIETELFGLASDKVAESTKKFFKIGKGDYGEGDVFIGISVPNLRKIAKKYFQILDRSDFLHFLNSKIHEMRCFALLAMVQKFESLRICSKSSNCDERLASFSALPLLDVYPDKPRLRFSKISPSASSQRDFEQVLRDEQKKSDLVKFYLSDEVLRHINNWDLVDLSAYKILGQHCIKNRDFIDSLYRLADSENLWQKRISIVATLALIRNSEFEHTKKIARQFLCQKHDLLQKATGWMLREMGKKSEIELINFLKIHQSQMPKTMLSYACERLKPKAKP